MSLRTRNIIVILCMALMAAGLTAGLHFYLSFEMLEAASIAAIGFCVLLVLYNNLVLQRQLSRMDRYLLDVREFEREIASRMVEMEARTPAQQSEASSNPPEQIEISGQSGETWNISPLEPLKTNDQDDGDDTSIARIGRATDFLSNMAFSANNQANGQVTGLNESSEREPQDNIVTLGSRLVRKEKPTGSKAFKIKPAQLTQALDDGGAELFLQPIMELPSRNIRYFEAFVRLRIGDKILAAKQFLPAAKKSGQIARIDLLSLELTFKVVRGLQRQANDCPVFWNISRQSLGNKIVFNEILEHLRANQPLNRQLICEISHGTFRQLNSVQSDNLALVRDLGYEMSLDKISSKPDEDGNIEAILNSELFSIIKVPAMELMRIGAGEFTNFATHVVPLALNRNITLVASEVENDSQTISMIDADIFLAQGDALMPAKALKKELGGG